MTLFHKVKAAKDASTEASAKVHVEVAQPCTAGQTTQVIARAAAERHCMAPRVPFGLVVEATR